MTQHYNRPPLNPVHVYIQPVATTRSGGASLNANSTSPYADAAAALRAAGERADARHHLGRRHQPERSESSHGYREGTSGTVAWRSYPNEVFAKGGVLDDLKKALSERILNAELDEHLGDEDAGGNANRRNGYSKKTVLTGTSKTTLSIPRDRAGTFDRKLIAKYQRRFPDFDEKIISMHARGMSVREIRAHLEELYGIDVSPDLISAVTDAVLEEVAEWQNRPLDACFPFVFFDAVRVKIREGIVSHQPFWSVLTFGRRRFQYSQSVSEPVEDGQRVFTC